MQGDGERGLCSARNSSCLLLLPPHIFPLLQRGSSPWDTVPVRRTCSRAGSSPQATICPKEHPPAPPWCLHRLQGYPCTSCLSSCSVPGAHMDFSLHFFPHCLCSLLPFLEYVFTAAPTALLTGFAVSWRGHCRDGWNRPCPARGSPALSSGRPCSPPLPPAPTHLSFQMKTQTVSNQSLKLEGTPVTSQPDLK